MGAGRLQGRSKQARLPQTVQTTGDAAVEENKRPQEVQRAADLRNSSSCRAARTLLQAKHRCRLAAAQNG